MGRNDSNIDVVLLFLHRPRSPRISKASVFPCEEEEKQETDSEMKNSQQRFETEVKKTKGAQKGEGKWAKTEENRASALPFPLLLNVILCSPGSTRTG